MSPCSEVQEPNLLVLDLKPIIYNIIRSSFWLEYSTESKAELRQGGRGDRKALYITDVVVCAEGKA